MSSLRVPGLGPIIGHTTDHSATIWIRGSDPGDNGAKVEPNRRSVGLVAIVARNGRKIRKPKVYYFRLQREFDRTGVFELGEHTGLGMSQSSEPLDPDTEYEIRVGTFTIDDPNPDEESISNDALAERLPDAQVWSGDIAQLNSDSAGAQFRTFAQSAASDPIDEIGFVLGSCRYPGALWKVKHADMIFKPLLANAAGEAEHAPAQFVLMVGDQIYADRLGRSVPIGRANTFEEFQERYHTAFGSPNMRRLLRSVPTYMTLDDHEIEDNWTQDRASSGKSMRRADKRGLFNDAMSAYRSYQWLHGPRSFGERLFYDFECGGYPFFILDTRTQRYIDDIDGALRDNHLLGRPSLAGEEPSQLEFLIQWLIVQQREQGDIPKFIGSSSVFAPNPIDAREGRRGRPEQKVRWKEASDSWPAFPTTRSRLLESIVEHEIQNVVFLSGDIHCSNIAEIRYTRDDGDLGLSSFSITSSAFYWPFPFADGEPSDYVHDSRAKGQEDSFDIGNGVKMDYVAWNFTQEDNFCRIDVSRAEHSIRVMPYDKEGNVIRKGKWRWSNSTPLEGRLDLKPW